MKERRPGSPGGADEAGAGGGTSQQQGLPGGLRRLRTTRLGDSSDAATRAPPAAGPSTTRASRAPGDDPLAALVAGVRGALRPSASAGRPRPWCAGAVVLAGRGPRVVLHEAVGWALRYAAYDERRDLGVELPRERWVPMRPDTVFDLASLTKLFTAIAAAQQIERGRIALDERVAAYLPRFAGGAPRAAGAGKRAITVRQLLTHTSGLRAELPLYAERAAGGGAEPEHEARLGLLWREEPVAEPGSRYLYSDLNLIALQLLLEAVTGQRLDALVRDGISGPLGMAGTRFNPPPAWRPRIAATEDQRRPWGRLDRGLLHGVVHDENAHAMGGVAGHAGLFATAADLGALCRALLDGGGAILTPPSVALLLDDAGPPGDPHGLGFELARPWYMGGLAGPRAAGHTGFTGTSLVLDRERGGYLVLLTNAVHPVRSWRRGNEPRAEAATWFARWLDCS